MSEQNSKNEIFDGFCRDPLDPEAIRYWDGYFKSWQSEGYTRYGKHYLSVGIIRYLRISFAKAPTIEDRVDVYEFLRRIESGLPGVEPKQSPLVENPENALVNRRFNPRLESNPPHIDSNQTELQRRRNLGLQVSLVVAISTIAIMLFNVWSESDSESNAPTAEQELTNVGSYACRAMRSALTSNEVENILAGALLELNEFQGVSRLQIDYQVDYVQGCYETYVNKTTTTTTLSDANRVAQGRTCSQQWRSAHRETLSGGSQDIQLRATVFACRTSEEWTTNAISVGENFEGLLEVICATERTAPSSICD